MELGSHDIVLGRAWLSHFDVPVDFRCHKLCWPPALPPTHSYSNPICRTLPEILSASTKLAHVRDIARRDRLFATQEKDIAAARLKKVSAKDKFESCGSDRKATIEKFNEAAVLLIYSKNKNNDKIE
ncbi:hypothetical protein K3495_g13599 [Podosphaera aphanis]|nr:hypothetical protein K3495_g13599 [Podosphaera aphanis]